MKKILLLLLCFSALAASAQVEPFGKANGRVQMRNDLQVTGDLWLGFKDTTGAYPTRLGVIRWRPLDGYPYVYARTSGQRWLPLIPVAGTDTTRVGAGLWIDNGVIKGRIVSGVDTGMVTPVLFGSWQATAAKRITDAQFSGTTTKILTITFADGTQLTPSFNDNNTGGGGGVGSVNSGPLVGVFNSQAINDGSGNYTISYTLAQQNPFTVFARAAQTGVPSFQALSADFIQSGTFDPARLPVATATNTGALGIGDYNRLFTRQSLTNPTGTILTDIALGGQAYWRINTTGSRTLAFANLRIGDVFKITIFNASGASFVLSLPATSYIQGTGIGTSLTIPTGRSMVSLADYDGTSYWFTQSTF